jgi:hypothetical protein
MHLLRRLRHLDGAQRRQALRVPVTQLGLQAFERLQAARDAAERRRIAELVGCKPEDIDLEKSNPHNDHDDD